MRRVQHPSFSIVKISTHYSKLAHPKPSRAQRTFMCIPPPSQHSFLCPQSYFGEGNPAFELLRKPCINRCNHSARTTTIGIKVDHHRQASIDFVMLRATNFRSMMAEYLFFVQMQMRWLTLRNFLYSACERIFRTPFPAAVTETCNANNAKT